ncbi:hypothetical protein [Ammoniphilus sp. CFH 90114]|uniref:hypothetical protein n=1 Tax=Ammoniphilus sp. CFH 90114 TaxID=2493665 RepID=UPI0013E96FC1|nr:hypothetical protein [Ammoniphilus sp. CFH 90114]
MSPLINQGSEWVALLLFKPLHLLVAFVCFMSACLLVRYTTLYSMQIVFSGVNRYMKQRLASSLLLFVNFCVVLAILSKHLLPALILFGLITFYDLFRWITTVRRNKRLKTAMRELQP